MGRGRTCTRGMYGGAAPNPFVALAQVIAKLKDEDGKILIPGFYDKVPTPTAAELKAWKALPFDEEHYRETEVGSMALTGEAGFSVLERTWARPTLDVHGMPGGFIGRGGEDGDSGEGGGEGEHAAGAGYDAGGELRAVQGVCGVDLSEGHGAGGAADSLGRPDCGEYGQSLMCGRRRRRCMRCLGRRRCLCAGAGRSRLSATLCGS